MIIHQDNCVWFYSIEDAEIFLSGESYAGFYIPWIAEHIVSKQLIRKEDKQTGELYYERDVGGMPF